MTIATITIGTLLTAMSLNIVVLAVYALHTYLKQKKQHSSREKQELLAKNQQQASKIQQLHTQVRQLHQENRKLQLQNIQSKQATHQSKQNQHRREQHHMATATASSSAAKSTPMNSKTINAMRNHSGGFFPAPSKPKGKKAVTAKKPQ